MRVARLVHETDLVTSVYLRPSTRQPLPAPMPASTSPSGSPTPPTRARSATTPCPPTTADGYRISVKREPQGLVSSYIATALAVGDQLDVAAPRGQFVLDDGDGPVVLLSAGIGVTPCWRCCTRSPRSAAPREVWWLHTTRDPATTRWPTRRTAARRAARGAEHVFYTRHATGARDAWTAPRSPRSACRSTRSAYLCGPPGFMDAMTAALTGLGLRPSRIHTERFTSLTAINPGVVGAARPAPTPPGQAGQRADGHLRPRGAHRGLRRVRGQPAGDGRGLRRPDALVLPHRRLPHVRHAPARPGAVELLAPAAHRTRRRARCCCAAPDR